MYIFLYTTLEEYNIFIYIMYKTYVCVYMCIYIFIYDIYVYSIYIYVYIYTYISIYKEIYYKELVHTILKAVMPQPL